MPAPKHPLSTAPNPPSVAVVVVSCDKYADLWPPFFALFQKFWPDCPFPVYLVSNFLETDSPGVRNLKVGPDTTWSANLKQALRLIPEKHSLMFLDDLFLVGPVDTVRLSKVIAEFIAMGGNCLKIKATVAGDRCAATSFDINSPGTAYRASTVLTLWSNPVLQSILVEHENAWEFELNGSARTDIHPGFYVAKNDHLPIVNGVIKGRWSRRALRKIRQLVPDAIVPGRNILSAREELVYQFALLRSTLLLKTKLGRNRHIHQWLRQTRDRFSERRANRK